MKRNPKVIYMVTTFGAKKLITSTRYYKAEIMLYQSDVGGIFWRIENGKAEKIKTIRWKKVIF